MANSTFTRSQLNTEVARLITDALNRQNSARKVKDALKLLIDNTFNLADDTFQDGGANLYYFTTDTNLTVAVKHESYYYQDSKLYKRLAGDANKPGGVLVDEVTANPNDWQLVAGGEVGSAFQQGSFTATTAGTQTINVPGVVIFTDVSIEGPGGSLNPIAQGSGYTYSDPKLTILPGPGGPDVQPGEIVHYSYLAGTLIGGGSGGGGGGGGNYTDDDAKAAAAAQLLAAATNGVSITQVAATGQLVIQTVDFSRLYFFHPAAKTGNLLQQTFYIEPNEEGVYTWQSDMNIANIEYQSQGSVFNGTIAAFRNIQQFSHGSNATYYLIITPVDVNQPTSLTMRRL